MSEEAKIKEIDAPTITTLFTTVERKDRKAMIWYNNAVVQLRKDKDGAPFLHVICHQEKTEDGRVIETSMDIPLTGTRNRNFQNELMRSMTEHFINHNYCFERHEREPDAMVMDPLRLHEDTKPPS